MNRVRIQYLLRSFLLSIISTILFLLIFTLILRFTSVSEANKPLVNNIIMLLSIVFASSYAAVKIKEKGWINGAIVGFIYYLVIIIINVLLFKGISSISILTTKLLLSTMMGIIGGIIGINLV